MIKVNLKNTKTAISRFGYSETGIASTKETAQTQLSTVFDQIKQMDLSALDTTILLKIVIKFILLAAFPFSLKVYEIIHIDLLENQLKAEEDKTAQVHDKINQIQISINNYNYLKLKEEEFNRKQKMLSQLASSRLVIPRFLDEVQTSIPSSVLLRRIEVQAENEHKREVYFSGEGINEERINSFVEELKQYVDRNSLRLNTRDVKEGETTVKVSFDIRAELHN